MIVQSINNLDLSTQNLIEIATNIRNKAYVPYSGFKVGAALKSQDNEIFTGINIESADFTLTTHAEMDAINSMVKSGCLKFKEIAIVLNSSNGLSVPCGLCRQKMVEFAENENVRILGYNLFNPDVINIWTLGELLPFQFNKSNLE